MGFIGKNAAQQITYYRDVDHRYKLIIETNTAPTNTIIVIMKNPSSTCDNMPNGINTITKYSDKKRCHIDKSTGRVFRYLKKNYDRIITLNLYSLYCSTTGPVQAFYYNGPFRVPFTLIDTEITNVLNTYSSADIICAWDGCSYINSSYYDNRIVNVIRLLKGRNLLEYDLVTSRLKNYTYVKGVYPVHGFRWK